MPEEISKADERMTARKAERGELSEKDREIEDVSVDFDVDDFPELAEDREGDEVLVLMAGYVEGVKGGVVQVVFNRASLVHGRKPPLGSGERFRSLERTLDRRGDVREPAALAANIGRKKYGGPQYQRLAIRGRKS